MSARSEMIWHIEQIKQLKARYFRALDGKAWDDFLQVFTAEIVTVNRRAGGERRVSREDHVAFIRKLIGQGRSIHRGYTPEISLLDETTATGVWAMDDIIVYPPADRPQGFRGWGYYHDAYSIEGGRWRISATDLQRVRFEPLAGGLPPTVEPSPELSELVWIA